MGDGWQDDAYAVLKSISSPELKQPVECLTMQLYFTEHKLRLLMHAGRLHAASDAAGKRSIMAILGNLMQPTATPSSEAMAGLESTLAVEREDDLAIGIAFTIQDQVKGTACHPLRFTDLAAASRLPRSYVEYARGKTQLPVEMQGTFDCVFSQFIAGWFRARVLRAVDSYLAACSDVKRKGALVDSVRHFCSAPLPNALDTHEFSQRLTDLKSMRSCSQDLFPALSFTLDDASKAKVDELLAGLMCSEGRGVGAGAGSIPSVAVDMELAPAYADGNCLFNSIAMALPQKEYTIRQRAVQLRTISAFFSVCDWRNLETYGLLLFDDPEVRKLANLVLSSAFYEETFRLRLLLKDDADKLGALSHRAKEDMRPREAGAFLEHVRRNLSRTVWGTHLQHMVIARFMGVALVRVHVQPDGTCNVSTESFGEAYMPNDRPFRAIALQYTGMHYDALKVGGEFVLSQDTVNRLHAADFIRISGRVYRHTTKTAKPVAIKTYNRRAFENEVNARNAVAWYLLWPMLTKTSWLHGPAAVVSADGSSWSCTCLAGETIHRDSACAMCWRTRDVESLVGRQLQVRP